MSVLEMLPRPGYARRPLECPRTSTPTRNDVRDDRFLFGYMPETLRTVRRLLQHGRTEEALHAVAWLEDAFVFAAANGRPVR